MINDHTAFRTDWMPFAGRRIRLRDRRHSLDDARDDAREDDPDAQELSRREGGLSQCMFERSRLRDLELPVCRIAVAPRSLSRADVRLVAVCGVSRCRAEPHRLGRA